MGPRGLLKSDFPVKQILGDLDKQALPSPQISPGHPQSARTHTHRHAHAVPLPTNTGRVVAPHTRPPTYAAGGPGTLSFPQLQWRGRGGTLAPRQAGASLSMVRSSGAPALLPVTSLTTATILCPPRPGSPATWIPPTSPPSLTRAHSQHRAVLDHPRKWHLSPTKTPNKAWASRSKPNCREGDTTGGVKGGISAPRLRGATWANAATTDAPGRCLGRIAARSPSRRLHHPRAQLLTRGLSVL